MTFTWDLDPVIFEGSVPLRWYGLFFALAMVGGFFLWRWQMRKGGHSDGVSSWFLAYGLAGVIVGARLGHGLFYEAEVFRSVYAIWRGGMSSHGATVGLVVALWLFSRRFGIPLGEVTDRFSFSAALGATVVRLANFFNSEIVGRATDGGWGVRFPRYDRVPAELAPLRHPSQLYEVGLGLVCLGALWVLDRRQGEARPRGQLSAVFLISYFSGRFLVEWFKEYQSLPPGSLLTMGQILSLPPLAAGITWLLLRRRAFGGAP